MFKKLLWKKKFENKIWKRYWMMHKRLSLARENNKKRKHFLIPKIFQNIFCAAADSHKIFQFSMLYIQCDIVINRKWTCHSHRRLPSEVMDAFAKTKKKFKEINSIKWKKLFTSADNPDLGSRAFRLCVRSSGRLLRFHNQNSRKTQKSQKAILCSLSVSCNRSHIICSEGWIRPASLRK